MSKIKEEQYKNLDEFHYHEALDRCFLITDNVENHLLKHPVVQKHENLKEKIEEAISLLAESYQTIGHLQTSIFKGI